MEKKVPRRSNIELLRIVAMLMIIGHHFAYHGAFQVESLSGVPYAWLMLLSMGGKIGVNLFVLITGYFLVMDESMFRPRKLLSLWLPVFFYAALLTVIGVLTGLTEFSWNLVLQGIFPVLSGDWWFVTDYFLLFLLHPFLNKMVSTMTKKQFGYLVALILVLWCVLPSILSVNTERNNLLWFGTMYLTGGYLRRYGVSLPKMANFTSRHYFGFTLLWALVTYGVGFLTKSTETVYASAFEMYTLPVVLVSVNFFLAFEKWNMKYYSWVNTLASATFGVYLIHDSNILRPYLWQTIFTPAAYGSSLLVIPYSIGAILLIYAVCTGIDLLRQLLFFGVKKLLSHS